MVRWMLVGGLAGGLGGCDKNDASNVPAAVEMSHDTAAEAPAAPESTYVSTEDNEASEEDAASTEAETATEEKFDAEAARKLAVAAAEEVVDPYAPMVMTPALPAAWPLDGKSVVYIAYPLIPSQKSVTEYKVGAPVKVTLDLVAKTTSIEKLSATKIKTMAESHEEAFEHDRVAAAEQALIEFILGEREFSKAAGYLDGYKEWLMHHPKVKSDLGRRMGTVARWLEKPHE